MKILVSGATGFIGHHLTARLVKDGHEVWAVVRPSWGWVRSRMSDGSPEDSLRRQNVAPRQLNRKALAPMENDRREDKTKLVADLSRIGAPGRSDPRTDSPGV
jgi:dTDP-4-dehydrorhamnose reductase